MVVHYGYSADKTIVVSTIKIDIRSSYSALHVNFTYFLTRDRLLVMGRKLERTNLLLLAEVNFECCLIWYHKYLIVVDIYMGHHNFGIRMSARDVLINCKYPNKLRSGAYDHRLRRTGLSQWARVSLA